MSSDLVPLDPDQVECPRCLAAPGEVCRQPDGSKAGAIHVARRRAAERGELKVVRAKRAQPSPPAKGKPFDKATASAAAAKSAQARRRRRNEAEALIEQRRAEAEAAALEAEADALAADAVRYAKDRAVLRRAVLDAALKAHDRLIESLDGLQVVELDDERRPKYTTVELDEEDREGRPKRKQVVDVRGAYSAGTVERLAKVAASTINALRLEEGKPTGITRTEDGSSTSDILGTAGTAELLEYARKNLPPDPS